jgi:hypothetical protein
MKKGSDAALKHLDPAQSVFSPIERHRRLSDAFARPNPISSL